MPIDPSRTHQYGVPLQGERKPSSPRAPSTRYVGKSKALERRLRTWELHVELVPKNALPQRLPANGAGIPAVADGANFDTKAPEDLEIIVALRMDGHHKAAPRNE